MIFIIVEIIRAGTIIPGAVTANYLNSGMLSMISF